MTKENWKVCLCLCIFLGGFALAAISAIKKYVEAIPPMTGIWELSFGDGHKEELMVRLLGSEGNRTEIIACYQPAPDKPWISSFVVQNKFGMMVTPDKPFGGSGEREFVLEGKFLREEYMEGTLTRADGKPHQFSGFRARNYD